MATIQYQREIENIPSMEKPLGANIDQSAFGNYASGLLKKGRNVLFADAFNKAVNENNQTYVSSNVSYTPEGTWDNIVNSENPIDQFTRAEGMDIYNSVLEPFIESLGLSKAGERYI